MCASPAATVSQLLQRLRTDNTSGATQLQAVALDMFTAFLSQPLPTHHDEFYTALGAVAREIIAAQPSMAVMIHLAQAVLQVGAVPHSPVVVQQHLCRTLTTIRQQAHQSMTALCQHATTILPPQATVLTYSNSSTVTATLQAAHTQGRVRRVILSESRPAYDGRLQAQALAEADIDVEYGIDMSVFARLSEADVVLVGADAVFPHGLVNKLGTYALARLAQLQHVPIFSLSTSHKFLPAAAAQLLHITEHAAHEVWSAAPKGIRVQNHYFDTTPLDLFDGIISEQGLHTPDALRHTLQEQQLAPALWSLA